MTTSKPSKPTPDFPLFPHATKRWAKKIKGKMTYFGPWDDPAGALARYLGTTTEPQKLPSPEPRAKREAPARPAGFPLYAHSNGNWAKKVRGKVRYFGLWEDPQAALNKWLDEKDSLLAGREPRTTANTGLTVLGMVNGFLEACWQRVIAPNPTLKEMRKRTYSDYKIIGQRILDVLGRERLVEDLRPDDFAKLRASFAETHGAVALTVDIQKSRTFFAWAIDKHEIRVRYGSSFKKPSKGVIRTAKSAKQKRFFKAAEVRQMLGAASVPLKAMILLGINCGFGNDDCAQITIDKLDLDGGWHHFARPKTGVERRCPLWPETVEALRAAIEQRPKARDPKNANRVFITRRGSTWEKTEDDNPISKEIGKVMNGLGLVRDGRNFYAFRHTYQTVGDASLQSVAVRYVMGHVATTEDMAARYREETFETNLLAASDFVRAWVFKSDEPDSPGSTAPGK